MYKYDIHVHTSETSPCGKVEAIDVVKLYKKAGYTGIIITDHYLKGYKKALIEGGNIGLNVLLGMEIKFNDNPNDYLVYGIDEEFLKDNPELYNINLREFRNLIANRDMLIFQAHPFRKGQHIEEPELLDGIEVYNGNPRHNSHNDQAFDFAIKNQLRFISGSDFHQIEDLARGGIIINYNITTIKELVGVLKENTAIDLIKTENYESI